jgi:crossover junction endodeoxyribonuclease RuvC
MNNIVGIDPGNSGAISFITSPDKPEKMLYYKLDNTERDIWFFIEELKLNYSPLFAYIEEVHSMPDQGIVGAFTFGKNYGFLIGLLTALKIPYEFVTPQKWKKEMRCIAPKGSTKVQKKNIDKAAAQRLFPDIKITHANADALLIAEYGRRIKCKQ